MNSMNSMNSMDTMNTQNKETLSSFVFFFLCAINRCTGQTSSRTASTSRSVPARRWRWWGLRAAESRRAFSFYSGTRSRCVVSCVMSFRVYLAGRVIIVFMSFRRFVSCRFGIVFFFFFCASCTAVSVSVRDSGRFLSWPNRSICHLRFFSAEGVFWCFFFVFVACFVLLCFVCLLCCVGASMAFFLSPLSLPFHFYFIFVCFAVFCVSCPAPSCVHHVEFVFFVFCLTSAAGLHTGTWHISHHIILQYIVPYHIISYNMI